jgi:CBS domain-containing protein
LFSRELERVRLALDAAQDGPALQRIAGDIRALLHGALDLPAQFLTRMISALNDALTRRVIDLARAEMRMDAPDWCWVALGSEGRQEQTFASDQDNGIIFPDGSNADAQRERLLPLASRINLMLADCGFALCRGNIMASNPECCLSQHEWRARFSEWMIEGDAQALLNASIFFDFRPLYGDAGQSRLLGEWLTANAADNPRFLLQMSENALRRDAPLGILHGFALEKSGEFAGTIDLKLQAATLFVDAARVFALACGSHAGNTADRLRHAAQARLLEADECEAWVEAFYFIEMLRLKCQHASAARGEAMHNHIAPSQLEADERHALLDALHQARALQKSLARTFPGSA